jgi:hypothetical protein
MPAVRATLTTADGRSLGWLTNEHSEATGEAVLVLDAEQFKVATGNVVSPGSTC